MKKNNKERSLKKSKILLERAEKIIPRGAQTLSKAPDQFIRGVSPYAIAKGKGCHVWDIDGNEYIDLASSLGAIVLGHQFPLVEKAIKRQRKNGTLFSLPGALEVELAERIQKMIPFIDMVRFGMNGSDATSGAIRVARAYTGRDHVAKCGYHGWTDWSIATNPLRSKGVPQAVKDLTHEFKYNDIQSLEKIFQDFPQKIAAVILEPVSTVLPEKDFLNEVKKLAHKNGAILIFDELVTGFRLARGGAAEYFKVEPDLACYGKAISNGEPLSVFGGKREIMDVLSGQDVFFSFTYAGYLPSIAVAIEVLKFMEKNDVQKKLWKTGDLLIEKYKKLTEKYKVPTKVTGIGPHPIFAFKDEKGGDNLALKSLFLQETAKRGILTNCSNLTNYSHEVKDIEEVAKRLEEIFVIMEKAVIENRVEASLEGPMIRPRSKPL